MDEETPKSPNVADDDAYVIEDTGQSVDEIEHEMERTANEAAQERPAGDPPVDAQEDERRQLHDRYLRTLADFENFRRRSEREKNDFHRYALAGFIRDLLPILDNFDRALEHAEEGDDFHKGVLLIYKQLFDVLKKNGVRTIEETGVPFDPNIHEAVIREEDPSVPSHTVTAVLQKGYFLHDRLLRPAMVKVAVE
ncbi:MAG TPA: nucleotide exchange factor GrpE [Thermoanaerobaculia bacterium]|nr:nucleotide exchange factor GrpE [Thermoanaerobaculia bacterium]